MKSIVLALMLALPAVGQNFLSFTSSPESVIGQGETFTASTANGFTIDAGINSLGGVSLVVASETRYWFLDFANGGIPLAVGHYEAVIFPAAGPSLQFSGEGRAVNAITGGFDILAIEYSAGGVTRFEADFLQNDNGNPAAWNQGHISFVAVPEPTVVALSLLAVVMIAFRWRTQNL